MTTGRFLVAALTAAYGVAASGSSDAASAGSPPALVRPDRPIERPYPQSLDCNKFVLDQLDKFRLEEDSWHAATLKYVDDMVKRTDQGVNEVLQRIQKEQLDIVERARALDARAAKLEAKEVALSKQGTERDERLTKLEAHSKKFVGDVGALAGRATNLEASGTKRDERLTKLEAYSKKLVGDVGALAGRATNLETSQKKNDEVNYKDRMSLQGLWDLYRTHEADNAKAFEKLEGDIGTLAGRANSLETRLKVNEEVDDKDMISLKGLWGLYKTHVTDNAKAFEKLEGDVGSLADRANSLENKLKANEDVDYKDRVSLQGLWGLHRTREADNAKAFKGLSDAVNSLKGLSDSVNSLKSENKDLWGTIENDSSKNAEAIKSLRDVVNKHSSDNVNAFKDLKDAINKQINKHSTDNHNLRQKLWADVNVNRGKIEGNWNVLSQHQKETEKNFDEVRNYAMTLHDEIESAVSKLADSFVDTTSQIADHVQGNKMCLLAVKNSFYGNFGKIDHGMNRDCPNY